MFTNVDILLQTTNTLPHLINNKNIIKITKLEKIKNAQTRYL